MVRTHKGEDCRGLKTRLATAIAACLLFEAAGDTAADAEPDDPEPWPEASAVLASVTARLPDVPLGVEGDIEVRRRKGVITERIPFRMELEWGRSPPRARYTVYDAFGRPAGRMTAAHTGDGRPHMRFEAGDPLADCPAPAPGTPIGGSDLTWSDLSLAFLWWDAPRFAGQATARGRDCFLIDVDAPADGRPARRVRLWIDRELRVVLQAEAYDAAGALLRRLTVRSVKKTDARWMIKDLDVERPEVAWRTRLRVHAVRPLHAGGGEDDDRADR
jgi:hypothetical protein